MLMDIPDFQKLMLPFLEVIKDGRVYSTEQIVEMLRVHFGLTMEDMKLKVLEIALTGLRITCTKRDLW